MRVAWRVLVAAGSGGLLWAAFPKLDLCWLAWVALAPFFGLYAASRPPRPGLTGWVFGLAFATGTLHFVAIFGYLPVAALVLQQSVFYWVLGALLALAARRGAWARTFGFAALWTAAEWARSLGPLGHTIGALGYSQQKPLVPVQCAALTGVFGVSFVVALVNACLAAMIMHRRRGGREGLAAPVTMAALLLAACLGFGWWRLGGEEREATGPSYRVGVVQTEVKPGPPGTCGIFAADDFEQHIRATEAMPRGTDLVVWPETVVTESVLGNRALRRPIEEAARRTNAFVLAGSTEREGSRKYNSAVLFGPDGEVVGRYDKRHLVVFGEYVPLREQLAMIFERYPVPTRDYAPGRYPPVLRAGRARLGMMICFEALFPWAAREARNLGANLLVVTTNDGWFLFTAGGYHSLIACALRAVENNAPMVRAAKTGVSCFIDTRGRIHSPTRLFEAATLHRELRLAGARTLYDRIGDLLAVLCVAWAVWLVVATVARRGKRRTEPLTG